MKLGGRVIYRLEDVLAFENQELRDLEEIKADLSTAETKPATGRRKTRPVAGIERHGARARQIAGAGHGALARRAKSRLLDQVLGGVFRARLWPSR